MKNLLLFALLCLVATTPLFSQEEEVHVSEYAFNTFEGTRVVVGHSVEMLKEGEMDFLISHKFGRLNGGLYELFGLDQAIIRLGLDYAIKDWITIGLGRSSLDKQLDASVKLRLLRQQKGSRKVPLSITGLITPSVSLLRSNDPLQPLTFSNKLSYTFQLFMARQFNDRFSVQVMPTLTHYNLVETAELANDVIAFGIASKYQLTKSLSLKGEYYYALPNQLAENKTNSLAFGIDIDTGSHVFQLHFSNSGGLVEPAFIGNTTGKWLEGDIHFGFTMSRVFRLKGRRY